MFINIPYQTAFTVLSSFGDVYVYFLALCVLLTCSHPCDTMLRFLVIVHSRFILDLRGLYFADSGNTEQSQPPSHWSGINFRGISSRVVGNLGATLDLSPGSEDRGPRDAALTTAQHSADRQLESDWEDEVAEYCDDPFTTGMKDTGSSEVAAEARRDSEMELQVSLRKS